MLSYVFWHWPLPGIAVHEYVALLREFHRELSVRRPAGLQASAAWHADGASWAPESPAFEDWYLVDGSADLDTLAEAAISGSLRDVHDAAAREAGGGAAGLYKPVGDEAGLPAGSVAVWFNKPHGLSYAELFAELKRLDPQITAHLWQRFLVLGPTPEFCLLGDEIPVLPGPWPTTVVRRRRAL
jgi:hypothetical protein